VFDELQRDHNLGRKMLAGMAMRLHQLMTDVESYSLHSGKERIIGYLLRELPANTQDATQVTVQLPTNKGIIASRLNLTQEHFSRILHELTDDGLIVVEGRKIHIPSVPNLRKHQG
jgi:CRP-like cAMP-binding protein